jgi:TonB-dependent receptor
MFKRSKLADAIATALVSTAVCGGATNALAQTDPLEEVIVTGIRGSLQRSMDLKRDAAGVVDGISAEDIGKFPDTNLAESLQRITGVSIDRVNGEGSNVTVRGFGGGNNLVTLNGRHMPAANVATIGGDQNSDFAQGSGRSFDFSNLASEGVSGLEVYKTGRASVPTGGIGATINIKTLRPLDNPGFQASIGAKAVNDTGVVDGDEITPELSGLVSWTDPNEMFGVSLFVSSQERHSSSRSATVNGWNIRTYDFFSNNDGGTNGLVRADGSTVITNAPDDGNQLVSFPNDSRWHLSEVERERQNAMLTLQFRPMDSLTLTLDALTVENSQEETRNDSTNWFNRPFDEVIFEDNPVIASTVFLYENLGGGVKDMGFEQQLRSVEDTMDSVGFNVDFQVNDSLSVNFDIHSSESESLPTAGIPGMDAEFAAIGLSNSHSAILISMGAPVVAAHSLNFMNADQFPVQTIWMDDAARGNGNGVLDAGDLGTQVARTISSSQTTTLDEAKIDLTWEHDIGTLDFGFDTRSLEMKQFRTQTQQTLGDWGIGNPGEVPANLVEAYCLACLFDDFEPNASGAALVSFKGNAAELYGYFSPTYIGQGNAINLTNIEDNTVEEDISAFYVQYAREGDLGGVPYELLVGLRYETTDVTSTSLAVPVTAVVWQADNDFSVTRAPIDQGIYLTQTGEYSNTLPSIDVAFSPTEDIKLRGSISKTIARPGYGDLFVADTAGAPNRPGALGGVPTGTSGNANLKPLESTNVDLSFEWYYGDANYFSIGTYNKDIENFIGSGVENRPLFDLRDPSSGQPGTRSGDARAALIGNSVEVTDVTLFTLTAMMDNPTDPRWAGDPLGQFLTEFANQTTFQAFVDSVLQGAGGNPGYDILADGNDPLFNYAVQIPVNTEVANIHGFEVAWQHFFGESGFGFLVNYTTVDGDIRIDVGADPSVNQFALLGLSDSANLSLIYENFGLAARLSYNWRDEFLNETNRGADRNPVFVDEYSQIDLNVSYDVTDNLSLSFEAINLTSSDARHYGRDDSNLFFMQELDTRYLIGARFSIE